MSDAIAEYKENSISLKILMLTLVAVYIILAILLVYPALIMVIEYARN